MRQRLFLPRTDSEAHEVDQLDQSAGKQHNKAWLTNLTNRKIEALVGALEAMMAANPIPQPNEKLDKPTQVNIYQAKTQLSSLVERAAKGEEIVIAKAGKPMAKLIAIEAGVEGLKPLRKFGQNLLGITYRSDNWEKDIPLSYFQDEGEENPFGAEAEAAEPR